MSICEFLLHPENISLKSDEIAMIIKSQTEMNNPHGDSMWP